MHIGKKKTSVSDKLALLFSIQNTQSLWADDLVFQLMMTDIY